MAVVRYFCLTLSWLSKYRWKTVLCYRGRPCSYRDIIHKNYVCYCNKSKYGYNANLCECQKKNSRTLESFSQKQIRHQWNINTLRTGDADLRFYVTTAQDGWRKSAFLTRACFPCTIHLIMQYIEPVSEWSCWRMFVETWPHSELTFRHRASSI